MLNHISGLVGTTLRGARWVLPWLCLLALSASIAYATTVALGGAVPVNGQREVPSGGQTMSPRVANKSPHPGLSRVSVSPPSLTWWSCPGLEPAVVASLPGRALL